MVALQGDGVPGYAVCLKLLTNSCLAPAITRNAITTTHLYQQAAQILIDSNHSSDPQRVRAPSAPQLVQPAPPRLALQS